MHRDNPTLSAAEARIQWYREPSRMETSLAAVNGHDVCNALLCPLRSTPLALAAFMTVRTKPGYGRCHRLQLLGATGES